MTNCNPSEPSPPTRILAGLLLLSCAPPSPGIEFVSTQRVAPMVEASLRFIGDPRLSQRTAQTPERAPGLRQFVVAVVERADCTECYRIDREGHRFTISGGSPLGLQYGIAHLLELHGYRFHHPWRAWIPEVYLPIGEADLGKDLAPEVDERRGLHLHTLHPTEAMHDFCVPSARNLEGAKRTIDFVVKNRGNQLSWYALDDITAGGPVLDAWRAHTSEILTEAKSRGVLTSVTVQLFGRSNLQNAFDLIDDDQSPDPIPELERRLHVLLDELPFDSVSLSFGEFSRADPHRFVQLVDATYAALQRVRPGVGVTAVIHVGNSDALRVEYRGTRQLYYFLVRYANPAIVPWVHTVFYYNLYDDAGGAYLHDDFSEHRSFLEGRLRAGSPVGYYPESAYWVAWDNSVPTYLPLYVKSRHLELERLRQAGPLRRFQVFSSGWEWGYWQNDVANLRMAFALPDAWAGALREQFAPFGAPGARAIDVVEKLGELQYEALIGRRLGPYLAGRDAVLEVGKSRGIVAQPDRVTFAELVAMKEADRQAFQKQVLDPLGAFAAQQTALDEELRGLSLPPDNPYFVELLDGVAITAVRGRFMLLAYRVALARANGQPFDTLLSEAEAELARAEAVVSRRRKALWDPDPAEVLGNHVTPTLYDYGYLREADTLCFWKRERAQLRQAVLGESLFTPGCVL
ncbi:MAG: hypothetical protein JNJ54_05560 [Myxococcaceae bacterium]|nr:hypothetical protein [Myxococcaceae bacterium]